MGCIAQGQHAEPAETDDSDQSQSGSPPNVTKIEQNIHDYDISQFIPASNSVNNIQNYLRFIKPLGKGASGQVVLATYQNYIQSDLSVVHSDPSLATPANNNNSHRIRLGSVSGSPTGIEGSFSPSFQPYGLPSMQSLKGVYNESGSNLSVTRSGLILDPSYHYHHSNEKSGSFGFLDKMQNERFALKILKKKHKENKRIFYNESKILTKLSNCDGIVNLITCYMDNKNYYIAIEYCKGGALLDVIRKCKFFSEQQASYYIKSILDIVKYMHSMDIVHRDLKPGNIVFDKVPIFNENFDGKLNSKLFINDAKLMLIDFGEAIDINNQTKGSKKIAGTIVYLPPEVFDNSNNKKERNGFELKMGDMWTIGVITYILLVGKVPFWGNTDKNTINLIATQDIIWPKNDGTDRDVMQKKCGGYNISERGKDFVNKLLNKNANNRMNANESLSHEWIIDNHNNPNETLRNYTFANKELFSHVANFHDAPPLEKILVNQAVSELTDDDKQWLKTQFNKIDVKKIGIITIDDICNFLLKTDDTLDERKALVKASKLVNMMDVSNKGQITLKDFVRAKTLSLLYAHLGSNEEIQLKGFEMLSNKLDRNNTGQIDSSMLEVELARSLTTAEKNAFMKQISQFQSSSSSASSATMNVNSSGNEQLSLMSSNVSNISNVSSGSSNNNNNNNNGKGVSTTAKNLSEIEMGNGVEDRGLEMINSGSGMIDLKLVGYLGSVPPSDNEFDTSDNDDHNTNNNNNNNNNNSKYSKVATKITANTSDQGTAALSDGNQSSLEMDINNNRKRKDGKGNHRVKSNKQMVPGSSLEINVIPPPCAQTDTEMQNGNGGNNNNNNNRMTTMTIPSQKGHRSDKSTSI